MRSGVRQGFPLSGETVSRPRTPARGATADWTETYVVVDCEDGLQLELRSHTNDSGGYPGGFAGPPELGARTRS